MPWFDSNPPDGSRSGSRCRSWSRRSKSTQRRGGCVQCSWSQVPKDLCHHMVLLVSILQTLFPSQFKFSEYILLLTSKFRWTDGYKFLCMTQQLVCVAMTSQLALRRWPNVGIGRHRRDRQPTSRQRWYFVACVATVCWHSVGARRLAYRSLPMFCVWTSVVGIKCFSNKCCRSTRLSIHQLHI